MNCDAKTLLPLLRLHGRTRFEESRNALFFNWTCSGFTVRFQGTRLSAGFLALPDRMPFPPDSPEDLPLIGITDEGGEALSNRWLLQEGENRIGLYSGDNGDHSLRIVKLSENMRGKAALLFLETDGTFLPAPPSGRNLRIEFVGDSITCGFGNEAPGRDSLFDTREENGWISYGAVCARKLNADFSMVSVSGIATGAAKYPLFPGKNMEDLYEYTDLFCDERNGDTPEKWPFADSVDWVVINLGTNDSARIWASPDLHRADEEADQFSERYSAFLRLVRACRPSSRILCTLGPMDYYLYDRIEKAVEKVRAETGDQKIAVLKLRSVNLITEGYGAVSHPSARTHQRMGLELAERIRSLME